MFGLFCVMSTSPPPPTKADEVTHQECVLLNRVLSDKDKLPTACRAPPSKMKTASTQEKPANQQAEGGIGSFVRRLTGAVPGAFNSLNVSHTSKKGVYIVNSITTSNHCYVPLFW